MSRRDRSALEAYFSPDYSTARARFRNAAAEAGWSLAAHDIGLRGPDGAALTIDVAMGPDPGAGRTLLVSSGLHGVEGLFGSAVQLALLDRWRVEPAPVRCVCLHALNPFGFAWRRRCDDRNVDLNRNFLLPGEPYAGAPPGYAELDPLLNPRRPPSRWEPVLLKMAPVILRHGFPAIRRAVVVGQYDFPRGLFYGGAGPSPLQQILEAGLPEWIAGNRRVMHLDLHTGLGRRAHGQLLIDYSPTDGQRSRLTELFGAGAFQTPDSARIAYTARGGLGLWCVSRQFADEYVFAYAEFGTRGGATVVAALRSENQAHHWARPDDLRTARVKARLTDVFCPPDRSWRARALAGAVDLIARAAS